MDLKVQQSIKEEEALKIFLRKIREFDQLFCSLMVKNSNFTLRLEIRGNKSEIIHARVYIDDQEQVPGAEKRIESKS